MKAKIFLTGIALVAAIAISSAQNPVSKTGNGTGTAQGASFVDTNQNGTCDNFENRTASATVGKQNGKGAGQGICNGTGQGKGKKQGLRQV